LTVFARNTIAVFGGSRCRIFANAKHPLTNSIDFLRKRAFCKNHSLHWGSGSWHERQESAIPVFAAVSLLQRAIAATRDRRSASGESLTPSLQAFKVGGIGQNHKKRYPSRETITNCCADP